jgi:organic radical activating enzyme
MQKNDLRYIPNETWPIAKQKCESSIELHVSHSCNLTCDSCSHYSNHGHKGMLSVEDAEKWMGLWCNKIKPDVFSLMGGEPTLNHNMVEIVKIAINLWKNSQIRLITNGFFLHLHPNLPQTMSDSNAVLRISIHHDSPEYQKKLIPIRKLINNWKNDWPNLNIEWKNDHQKWIRQYKGFGDNIMPYDDNNQRKSWMNCGVKFCRQLHEEKLWKCPCLAYLPMQNDKFKLHDSWKPYLKYKPLEHTCTRQELIDFYESEDETYCTMCPANNTQFELPSPLIPISELLNK